MLELSRSGHLNAVAIDLDDSLEMLNISKKNDSENWMFNGKILDVIKKAK